MHRGLALFAAAGVLGAPTAASIAHADPTTVQRHFSDSLHAYTIQLGLDSAAPVLFQDVPDMTLEQTRVFVYGGHAAFLFGDERLDAHRLGLSVGYDTVARSTTRKMSMITPELVYETGHPLVLQVGLGWAIPTGTAGFADQYGGLASSASLRWSFLQGSSKVSAAFGLTGRVIAATKSFDHSSAFLGAQLDLAFHLGGAQ